MTEFDVLIVGSGISGIGSACHLKMDAPWASFAVLEGRERLGGTWDLFRYPGIRSDYIPLYYETYPKSFPKERTWTWMIFIKCSINNAQFSMSNHRASAVPL